MCSLHRAKDKGRGCGFSCFRTGMQTWRRAHKQGVGAMVLQERLRGLLAQNLRPWAHCQSVSGQARREAEHWKRCCHVSSFHCSL